MELEVKLAPGGRAKCSIELSSDVTWRISFPINQYLTWMERIGIICNPLAIFTRYENIKEKQSFSFDDELLSKYTHLHRYEALEGRLNSDEIQPFSTLFEKVQQQARKLYVRKVARVATIAQVVAAVCLAIGDNYQMNISWTENTESYRCEIQMEMEKARPFDQNSQQSILTGGSFLVFPIVGMYVVYATDEFQRIEEQRIRCTYYNGNSNEQRQWRTRGDSTIFEEGDILSVIDHSKKNVVPQIRDRAD